MKKWFLIILAAMLLCLPLSVWAEDADPTPPPPPEEREHEALPEEYLPLSKRVAGDWYADYVGLVISLNLGEDGGYTVTVPGVEPLTGKWEAKDGAVVFDADEGDALFLVNGVLRWDSADLLFTREKPEAYTPAEVIADAKEGDFDGYWKAHFFAVGDATILASALGDNTVVYIEGTNVALGGDLFGNVIKVFAYDSGALTLTENGATVTIELQQDRFLRLALSGEETATLYLMPAVIPGTEPAEIPNP